MDIWFQDSAHLAFSLLSLVTPHQDPKVVLVREPGEHRYGPERPAAELAEESWQYGLLSAFAYKDNRTDQMTAAAGRMAAAAGHMTAGTDDVAKWEKWIDDHWDRWKDFPSDELQADADGRGLYFDVYESRSTSEPKKIVVAFRGTEGSSWRDWLSNFRWFRLTRFLPGFRDQYTVVAENLVDEFARQLVARELNREGVEIITTGHSLGGGLAQQFAYALKAPDGSNATIQPVSKVYAFHPSPVTGWFSVPAAIRDRNVKNLCIDRIFEHGEILAYIRLLLSQINPPSAKAPAIREIRFNFVDSKSTTKNHGMQEFAMLLTKRAQA